MPLGPAERLGPDPGARCARNDTRGAECQSGWWCHGAGSVAAVSPSRRCSRTARERERRKREGDSIQGSPLDEPGDASGRLEPRPRNAVGLRLILVVPGRPRRRARRVPGVASERRPPRRSRVPSRSSCPRTAPTARPATVRGQGPSRAAALQPPGPPGERLGQDLKRLGSSARSRRQLRGEPHEVAEVGQRGRAVRAELRCALENRLARRETRSVAHVGRVAGEHPAQAGGPAASVARSARARGRAAERRSCRGARRRRRGSGGTRTRPFDGLSSPTASQ